MADLVDRPQVLGGERRKEFVRPAAALLPRKLIRPTDRSAASRRRRHDVVAVVAVRRNAGLRVDVLRVVMAAMLVTVMMVVMVAVR